MVSFLPWAPVTDIVNFPKKTSKFELKYYSTCIDLPWVSVTKIGGWSTFRSCAASYSVTGKKWLRERPPDSGLYDFANRMIQRGTGHQ